MKTRKTKAEKLIDDKISRAYYATCNGVQINIMDIPKVFAEGRKALAEGRDLMVAIPAYVETIRKN